MAVEPLLSVILPAHNEAENIPQMARRLAEVLPAAHIRYEVLFVNDGSTDNSWDAIRQTAQAYPQVRGIRFYRALSAWVGFRTARVEFDVQPRTAGQSSWSTFSLIRYAISSLASFTSAPLYLVILMSFLMLIATLLVGGEALFRYLAGEALEGFTTVILLQLFTGTLLMFSLGIIGYYLAKIYDEVKRRPRYIIAETLDDAP